MFSSFKQYMTLNRNDLFLPPVFMSFGFLFGQLLLAIAISLDGPSEWFPIASLMVALCGAVSIFFIGGNGFVQGYRHALIMSRCRKPTLAAGTLFIALSCLLMAALAILFLGLDLLIARLFYRVPDLMALEVAESIFRAPWVLLPAVPSLTCSALLVGAINTRISRKTATLLYVLLICSSNLITPISTAITERPDGLPARIFRALADLPPVFWIAAVILLLGLFLWIALRMLYTLRADI